MITEKVGTGPGWTSGLAGGATLLRMARTIVVTSRPDEAIRARVPRYLVGPERREDRSGRQWTEFALPGVAEGPPPATGCRHPARKAPSIPPEGGGGGPLSPARRGSSRLGPERDQPCDRRRAVRGGGAPPRGPLPGGAGVRAARRRSGPQARGAHPGCDHLRRRQRVARREGDADPEARWAARDVLRLRRLAGAPLRVLVGARGACAQHRRDERSRASRDGA